MLGHREQPTFQKKVVPHAEQFLSQHLQTGLLLNSWLHSCYSNHSVGRICWHLDGLHFSDIWRGDWRQSLMRALSDIQWLPFRLDHTGGVLSVAFCQSESGAGLSREQAKRRGRAQTPRGWGEGWRHSWNVVGHAAFCSPPSACCGFGSAAKGALPALCP